MLDEWVYRAAHKSLRCRIALREGRRDMIVLRRRQVPVHGLMRVCGGAGGCVLRPEQPGLCNSTVVFLEDVLLLGVIQGMPQRC